MGLLKKPKPKLKSIDLSTLDPTKLHYFCKTSVIDRIRCKRAKIEFKETLTEALEEKVRFYFVVKTNLEYDIINGILFEPWIEENKLEVKHQTKAALNCINDYINDLG